MLQRNELTFRKGRPGFRFFVQNDNFSRSQLVDASQQGHDGTHHRHSPAGKQLRKCAQIVAFAHKVSRTHKKRSRQCIKGHQTDEIRKRAGLGTVQQFRHRQTAIARPLSLQNERAGPLQL